MARYADAIGVASTVEGPPGIFKEVFTEKIYVGDILRDSRRWQDTPKVNSDLSISNRISIVADAYALANFSAMRYAKLNGVSWKILEIEIQRPRLILTLGEVYNAPS